MKFLDYIEEWLISFLMAGATLLIFLAVIHRYAASFSIPGVQDVLLSLNFSWSQELCIIMFVWMAKFGAAYGVRTGIHVGVDVLVNRMTKPVRGKFIIFALTAGAVFTGTISALGGNFIWENGMHHAVLSLFSMDASGVPEGPTTPDLEWPTWLVYSAIPLGSGLMCFRFLQVLAAFVRTGALPRHDHSHVEGVETNEMSVIMDSSELDDNSHPNDLAHTRNGKDSKSEGAR